MIKRRVITDVEVCNMSRTELLMWEIRCYNMLGIGPFKWLKSWYDAQQMATVLEWEPRE